jgi:hypothetical protein
MFNCIYCILRVSTVTMLSNSMEQSHSASQEFHCLLWNPNSLPCSQESQFQCLMLTFRSKVIFHGEELLTPPPKPQSRGLLLVGCNSVVQRWATGWKIRVSSPGICWEFFLYDILPRPALVPIQPPMHWVTTTLSLGGKGTESWCWPLTSI